MFLLIVAIALLITHVAGINGYHRRNAVWNAKRLEAKNIDDYIDYLDEKEDQMDELYDEEMRELQDLHRDYQRLHSDHVQSKHGHSGHPVRSKRTRKNAASAQRGYNNDWNGFSSRYIESSMMMNGGPDSFPKLKWKYPEWFDVAKSGPGNNYNSVVIIDLPLQSADGKKIAKAFKPTMGKKYEIAKIDGVQNFRLYDRWVQFRRIEILSRGEEHINEKYLWHGVRKKPAVDSVLQEGFRHEFTTTAHFGYGTYFATKASHAAMYGCPSEDLKCATTILFCPVILSDSYEQEYVADDSKYPKITQWQTNGATGLLYGSVTNKGTINTKYKPHSIYLIRNDVRAYPMYRVHFKRKKE